MVGAAHIALRTARATLGDGHDSLLATLRKPCLRLRLVLEPQQGAQARVDARRPRRSARHLMALRPDTRACLRTQGDHRNSQQELVPDEVVQDDRVALVGDDVGLAGVDLGLVALVAALASPCAPRVLGPRGRSALRGPARAPVRGSASRGRAGPPRGCPVTTTSVPLFDRRTSSSPSCSDGARPPCLRAPRGARRRGPGAESCLPPASRLLHRKGEFGRGHAGRGSGGRWGAGRPGSRRRRPSRPGAGRGREQDRAPRTREQA